MYLYLDISVCLSSNGIAIHVLYVDILRILRI